MNLSVESGVAQWQYQTIKCEEDLEVMPQVKAVPITSKVGYINQIKTCASYSDKVVCLCRLRHQTSSVGCLITFKSSAHGIASFGSIKRIGFHANPWQLSKVAVV